jgi:hypothetical protein
MEVTLKWELKVWDIRGSQTPLLVEDEAPFENTQVVLERKKKKCHGFRQGPKPRTTVLVMASSKLLLCSVIHGYGQDEISSQ